MLLPSWKFGDTTPSRRTGPGLHREDVGVDDRSGPTWDTIELVEDGFTIELPVEEHDRDHTIDLTDLEEPTLVVPVQETPTIVPATETVVDRSEFLPAAPDEPSSSIAALLGFSERQVSFDTGWSREPEIVERDTAWDSLPTLEDVALIGDTPAGTGGSIQRLWDATEDHSIMVAPIEAASVDPQERLIDSRRFRRTALIALAGAVLLVAWGVRELGAQPERVAVAREVQYGTAARQITEAIGPVSRSVAILTVADAETSDFSQVTSDLDVLDGIARNAAGLAAEALPRSSIVGSSLPIDKLVLPRSLLEQGALQALNLERRVGDAVSYRLTFARAFDLPPLPAEASLTEIGTIGADLSVAIARTEQILAELPDDSFFAAHRQTALDLLTTITNAQVDYFEALRTGEVSSAAAFRDSISRAIDELRVAISEPLAATEAWTQSQVEQLRGVLGELDQLVSQND